MYGITGLGPAADNYIRESDNKADKAIKAFEEYIKQGYHPETVERRVWIETHIDPRFDLTDSDKKRIQRQVEEIYKAHRQGV